MVLLQIILMTFWYPVYGTPILLKLETKHQFHFLKLNWKHFILNNIFIECILYTFHAPFYCMIYDFYGSVN